MNTAMSFKRLAKFWWIMAVVFAIVWAAIWLLTDENTAKAKAVSATPKTISDLLLPKKIDILNDLSGEVSPLSVESVKQDLRNYTEEFKDKAFFEKNKNKWTVEVMDVTTHDNIANYLQIRKERHKDRDKFYYFRYVDDSSKEHYVLIYDLFPNKVMAMGTWQQRDMFELPKTTPMVVKPISAYLKQIDTYIREESEEDMPKIPKEPTVALKETDKQVKARPANSPTTPKKADTAQESEDNKTDKADKKQDQPKQDKQDKADKPERELAKPPTAKPNKDAPKARVEKTESAAEPDPAVVVTLEEEGGGQ